MPLQAIDFNENMTSSSIQLPSPFHRKQIIVWWFFFAYSPLIISKLQSLALKVSTLAFELEPTETKATACISDGISDSSQTQVNIYYCHSETNINCPVQQTDIFAA